MLVHRQIESWLYSYKCLLQLSSSYHWFHVVLVYLNGAIPNGRRDLANVVALPVSSPLSPLQLQSDSSRVVPASLCPHDDYHYGDVIMGAIASQITNLTIVYSTVYLDADHSKHQSSASQAFVRGIHRGPGNSPHKWLVTRKMFPFDDVIMTYSNSKSIIIQTRQRKQNMVGHITRITQQHTYNVTVI